MKYKTMEELIDLIDRPVNRKVLELYTKYKSDMIVAKGSQHNHQAWDGGYLDHISDTMNIARLLWTTMNEKRRLEFTLSDALIVLFFHDIEKAFPKRIQDAEALYPDQDRPWIKTTVRGEILRENGIFKIVTVKQSRALDNIEVERKYSNTRREMSPLAAFCHMCDVASARIWFDHPLADRESWGWRTSEAIGDHDLWAV